MLSAERLETIIAVEEAAVNAWPARESRLLDGWRLRHSDGVTRRANSVWPNGDEGWLELARKVASVEGFYAAHSLPARFQICPASRPPGLDAMLRDRGYRAVARTGVQIRDLGADRPVRTSPAVATEVAAQLSSDWLSCYTRAEGFTDAQAEGRRDILSRIRSPVGFALAEIEGETAAAGLGVVHADWLGISCMATLSGQRRRGAASAVLAALFEWAHGHGAERVYLQVMDENAAARALYAGLGFETLYHYHYRERSLAACPAE